MYVIDLLRLTSSNQYIRFIRYAKKFPE